MDGCKKLAKEGIRYVIPERKHQWIRCCQKAKQDDRLFEILNCVLAIIKGLSDGENCLNLLENSHLEDERLVIENYVVAFSFDGYEFVKGLPSYKSSFDRKKHIDAIHQSNSKFKSKIKKSKIRSA